ncbi:MAG: hypothetical protein M3Q86_12550, partial [Verrucomicrobiota bacterium]|nr:hypothetical protein [Verrucomicrobiota bacterium]
KENPNRAPRNSAVGRPAGADRRVPDPVAIDIADSRDRAAKLVEIIEVAGKSVLTFGDLDRPESVESSERIRSAQSGQCDAAQSEKTDAIFEEDSETNFVMGQPGLNFSHSRTCFARRKDQSCFFSRCSFQCSGQNIPDLVRLLVIARAGHCRLPDGGIWRR